MSNGICLFLNYKNACIVKHLLRDKPSRDDSEERLYQRVIEDVDEFRERYRIPHRSYKAGDSE